MPAPTSSSTSLLTVSPTEPKKNTCSDKTSSRPKPLNTPRSTPTQRTPSPSDTTSCPPGPMRNTRNFSVSEDSRTTLLKRPPFSPPKESQPPRTGDPSELLTQSRTKLNAVHAGLSQPPPPWSQLKKFKKVETSSPFPNKSSSLATPSAMDAKVDGNTKVWNTFNNTDKSLKLNTHTPQEAETPDLASKKEAQRFSPPAITTSNNTLLPNYWPLLPKDQSLLPLKPTRWLSKVTPVVFLTLPLAEPTSITLSPLSDMETKTDKTTTSSETLGDQPGEI